MRSLVRHWCVDVVASVPPGVKEPLEGCAEACAGMGSTLANNTFIFSLFHVKLREMLTNLSVSFLETLTDIVREAIQSESKTSSIEMLLLSTQIPIADSKASHVPVVKRGSTLRISAFAPLSMRPTLRLMRPSLLTCQDRQEMS